MGKTTTIIIGLVLIAGSFYAGTKHAGKVTPPTAQLGNVGAGFGTRVSNQGQNGSGGGGFAAGEIIAKDEKSITIRLRAGGSKIVFLTKVISVAKSVDGSVNDLIVGEQVSVTGTANPDGSISAQSVRINNSNN